ncbi:hypothetical protein N7450_000234 [Penicillium hetheringtonii]|uniref:Zn(2)-C6 fungal-type domain-containing protein n=1 Tax=Penicillium hetheringtonii TaxID=911720 RepID=A0AAD6E292_9EURO|nr:hypothetical protein N7450_000234 [Penicillium hetheringtonii]
MPFYGRPSKNCESCRIRRIKCDRIEPVCSQCRRAGKTCGGYRDIPSLLFRDENDKTVQRTTAARSKAEARRKLLGESSSAKQQRSRSKSKASWSGLIVQTKPEVFFIPVMPSAMPSSLENQGLRFFFNRFGNSIQKVANSPTALQISDLDKSPLMASVTNELPLRDAIIAVGLAAMSNVISDQSLLIVAREKYLTAINIVRSAVGSPHLSNPVLIFKIITILSLFEMVCCPSSQLDSWVVHLDGMAALLKQDSFSEVLYIESRARLQYLFLCVIRQFLAPGKLPLDLLNWAPENLSSVDPDERPAVDLVDILIRFTRLHHTIRCDPNQDTETTTRLIFEFDRELDKWEKNLPNNWAFTIGESQDIQHGFDGKYIIYEEVWPSRILNHYFWGRILVNEIIMGYLATNTIPTLRTLQQRQRALDTISRISVNICAGAASQMGVVLGNGYPCSGCLKLPPLNGVFMLLFPLTIAGNAAGAPDNVHEWVVETLSTIGGTMGIRRAMELIPKIKVSRENKRRLYSQANQVELV